jgi:hypothetical protein
MKFSAKVEGVEAMNRALQKFADVVGKDISAILPDEARLYCESAMKAQPPRVGKDGKGGNRIAERRAGEGAVQRSHENASPFMDDDEFKDGYLKAMARKGDVEALQEGLDIRGVPWKVGAFDPAYIKSRRVRGRVHRQRYGNILVEWAEKSRRDEHAKRKKQNVGMMKGAWGALIEKLNRYTVAKSKVAPWIKRNAGKGQAWLGSRVDVRLGQVTIQGASHPAMISFAEIAIQSRTKSIAKKTREILRGRAAIVNGKFTIFKRGFK